MAIDNYIANMQKQIKAQNQLNDLIRDIQALRTEAKHLFIYKSVKDYVDRDITLDEAKEFVKDNDVKFTSKATAPFSEDWTLTINGKEYKKTFNVKEKEEDSAE